VTYVMSQYIGKGVLVREIIVDGKREEGSWF
jgi:hypothetical protein